MPNGHEIFSVWVPWPDRDAIDGVGDNPGVYLLAHLKKRPVKGRTGNPQTEEIVYIGQTHKQKLSERMQQFHNSATDGGPGHAGGRTYYNRFHGIKRGLFVAVWVAPQESQVVREAHIMAVERRLIYEYTLAHLRLPICNRR